MALKASSTSSAKPVDTKLVGTILTISIVAVLVIVALSFVGNLQATTTADTITASGGNGKAATTGAAFNLKITATEEGGQCNYKGFWSDGTQEGSGYFQPCTEEGFQNFLKYLIENNKITQAFYDALKVVKFW